MRRLKILGIVLVLILFGTITVAPLLFLFCGSLMGEAEITQHLAPILNGTKGYASWRLFPLYPTLKSVVELVFDSPEFFQMFWNTMKITGGILLGQLVFGMPSAWGLARYRIPGRGVFYLLYIILMMLPFQVTMLSEYLVLSRLHMMDTLWAIIAPGAFSTFTVFLMYRFFCGIPEELLEAARMDGAGEWKIFFFVGVPLDSAGILSALVIQFLECFSMIEQPLVFLQTKRLWPLSMYLPEIKEGQMGFALACSFVALLPALCVFGMGQKYLEQGITAAAVKG